MNIHISEYTLTRSKCLYAFQTKGITDSTSVSITKDKLAQMHFLARHFFMESINFKNRADSICTSYFKNHITERGVVLCGQMLVRPLFLFMYKEIA